MSTNLVHLFRQSDDLIVAVSHTILSEDTIAQMKGQFLRIEYVTERLRIHPGWMTYLVQVCDDCILAITVHPVSNIKEIIILHGNCLIQSDSEVHVEGKVFQIKDNPIQDRQGLLTIHNATFGSLNSSVRLKALASLHFFYDGVLGRATISTCSVSKLTVMILQFKGLESYRLPFTTDVHIEKTSFCCSYEDKYDELPNNTLFKLIRNVDKYTILFASNDDKTVVEKEITMIPYANHTTDYIPTSFPSDNQDRKNSREASTFDCNKFASLPSNLIIDSVAYTSIHEKIHPCEEELNVDYEPCSLRGICQRISDEAVSLVLPTVDVPPNEELMMPKANSVNIKEERIPAWRLIRRKMMRAFN